MSACKKELARKSSNNAFKSATPILNGKTMEYQAYRDHLTSPKNAIEPKSLFLPRQT